MPFVNTEYRVEDRNSLIGCVRVGIVFRAALSEMSDVYTKLCANLTDVLQLRVLSHNCHVFCLLWLRSQINKCNCSSKQGVHD
jgi:hypothetical protein